jgi:hypothetical protein
MKYPVSEETVSRLSRCCFLLFVLFLVTCLNPESSECYCVVHVITDYTYTKFGFYIPCGECESAKTDAYGEHACTEQALRKTENFSENAISRLADNEYSWEGVSCRCMESGD